MAKVRLIILFSLFSAVLAPLSFSCDKNIQFSFKNNPEASAFTLNSPNRVVIDYKSSSKIKTNYYKYVDKKCIKSARMSAKKNGVSRIVYDLADKTSVEKKQVKTQTGYSLSIFLKSKESHPSQKKDIKKDVVKKKNTPKVTHIRDLVVVIDPGHGGFDPGAISNHGIKEKDITLGIAKKLAAKINATPGLKALMTRDTDKYVELRKRTEFATSHKADLFISIHADSHPNSSAKGVSVYALSESGATSEAARILADKENNLYTSKGKHQHHGYILESVLIDLQQVATVHQSLNLGKKILEAAGLVAKRHSRQVEQAAFVVLKSPSIPSVLIESGFVSNKREASRLVKSSYQDQLSSSFMLAIKNYFYEKKPQGSYFAADIKKKVVKVNKGDNLKKIALQYKVSAETLRKFNNLSTDKIYIGQSLVIPTSH